MSKISETIVPVSPAKKKFDAVALAEPKLGSWNSLFMLQKEALNFWRIALSGYKCFVVPSPNEVKIGSSLLSEEFPATAGEDAPSPAKVVDQNTSTETRSPTTPKEQEQGRRSASLSPKKHAVRHPSEVKNKLKRRERTAQSVLAGLRNRSLVAKSAAIAAMQSNKRYRTQKAIPLVQRIVDNKSLRERKPELLTAARTVLHMTREEGESRHPRMVHKLSPKKARS